MFLDICNALDLKGAQAVISELSILKQENQMSFDDFRKAMVILAKEHYK